MANWVMVPREPTPEMLRNAHNVIPSTGYRNGLLPEMWSAMIEAAPQQSFGPAGTFADKRGTFAEFAQQQANATYCSCEPSKCDGKGINKCRWELMRKAGWAQQTAELDALRKRATCKCGDEFTEHDPGTCGNCLAAITAGIDALRADAERYRWLRRHHYKHRSPNTEYDNSMLLSFHVSGVWSDNIDPRVLDGCIDAAMQQHKEQSND